MKVTKYLLPLVLLFTVLTLVSCSSAERTEAEDAIKEELDLLKNVDSETTARYISELSPEFSNSNEISQKITDVFTLFFQNFDYKILNTDVDSQKGIATSKIRIKTLDAQKLAQDFASSHLNDEILAIANQTPNTNNLDSVEQRYLLLYQLLTSNEYDSVEIDTIVELKRSEENIWEIQRTYSLENDLVGGLMTYLSDPNILTPDATLEVYLKSFKTMDDVQIKNYLGINSLFSSDEITKNTIADALVEQILNSFDYEIKKPEISGYNATVPVIITTFDSDSIISEYKKNLDTYISTPQAVIDGASARYEIAQQYLIEAIRNNDKTIQREVVFHLVNDVTAWHLEDNSNELGYAILGTMADSDFSESMQIDTETEGDDASDSDDADTSDTADDSDSSEDSDEYDYSDDEY